MKRQNILVVIFIVIILLIGYIWHAYTKPSSNPPVIATSSYSFSQEQELLGEEFLQMLNILSSIHLDTTLFDDPIFNELVDFSAEIVFTPIEPGRANPFAPFE